MRFGIIGYGRFGKLWADAISRCGQVFVYDKKFEIPTGMTAVGTAVDRDSDPSSGLGQAFRQNDSVKSQDDNLKLPDGVAAAALAEAANVDILFLLVPISEMENCCRAIAPLLKPNVIVVDACSVKIYPAKVMLEFLPAGQPIIATHPLFGPDSATRSGLSGHRVVVCPLRANAAQEACLTKIFQVLNLKIIETTPEEHDRQMARSQALVHFIGRGLADLGLTEQEISTPDYQTLLRMNTMVRNDTWQLFRDMQAFNPFAQAERKKLLNSLKRVEKKITVTNAEMTPGLRAWRERVNDIDAEILGLLADRLAAAARLAEIKKREGRPIEDADREKELSVLHREIAARLGLKNDLAEELFALIIKASKEAQM